MIADSTVQAFLDDLASSKPAPGGGSAAALSGALGAALVSMVCNLTVGKKKYAGVEEEIKAILEKSEALRHRLVSLIEDDIAAYSAVSEAFKMPRETEAQKAERQAAMQKALKNAVLPPMNILEACVEVLKLSMPTAEKGNVNAVSDAGVAAVTAEAGMRAAAMNVLINLGLIEDEAFVREQRARLESLTAGMSELKEQVVAFVESKL